MENQNKVITNKDLKSNNEEFKSNKQIEEMALDVMKMSSLPLEISGAIATDLTEIGYRKQVEAEWIDLHKGKYDNPLYVCSACRKGAYLKVEADELNNPKTVQALTDYCPHCGAKMKGN